MLPPLGNDPSVAGTRADTWNVASDAPAPRTNGTVGTEPIDGTGRIQPARAERASAARLARIPV